MMTPLELLQKEMLTYNHDLTKAKEGYDNRVLTIEELTNYVRNIEKHIQAYKEAIKKLQS